MNGRDIVEILYPRPWRVLGVRRLYDVISADGRTVATQITHYGAAVLLAAAPDMAASLDRLTARRDPEPSSDLTPEDAATALLATVDEVKP